MNTESPILTVKDVAVMLKVHHKTVAKLTRARRLPAHRVGKGLRYFRDEVLEWIRQGKVMPA